MISYHFQAFGILMIVAAWWLMREKELSPSLPFLSLSLESKKLVITSKWNPQRELLVGKVGKEFDFEGVLQRKCGSKDANNTMCIEWVNAAKLEIDYRMDGQAQCYDIKWMTFNDYEVPYDCFQIGDTHWYGGPAVFTQRWPASQQEVSVLPYLSTDLFQTEGFGGVLERYWLTSGGVAILIKDNVPLHFGSTESEFCFKADYKNSPYQNPARDLTRLEYTVCARENVKLIHEYMMETHLPKPVDFPDPDVFKYPIWSTWAKYKMYIDQDIVLNFAKEIKERGFYASQVEIDDIYTPTYGDLEFDNKTFPDAKTMTDKIHELGFRITSWIIPFANLNSKAFFEGMEKGYFVKDATGEVPGLVKWWQGIGAIIDFTNPSAVAWFGERLQKLRQAGVDSFKFDAGEILYLPPYFKTHVTLSNPNHFTKYYAEAVYNLTNRIIEVRAAYKTQQLPIWVRMMDKSSTWDYNMGYKTLIPNALQFGIIGYPFVLPDMIGGNAYSETGLHEDGGLTNIMGDIPEKELYIRWMELTTFLPSMQFSIAPWQYDEETVKIAKEMVKLHEEYVAPKMLKLAKESTVSGAPIIRPLWWVAPDDATTFDIDSEFLIGDDLLVAPIMEKGATSRDIYLPKGDWKDMLRGARYKGEQFLADYKIALHEIAYFERV